MLPLLDSREREPALGGAEGGAPVPVLVLVLMLVLVLVLILVIILVLVLVFGEVELAVG